MRILFIDDSCIKKEGFLGHGGFIIDAVNVRPLMVDLDKLKTANGIPTNIDLKWSPGKDHYLRTKYRGNRNDLYLAVIKLLSKYDCKIISSVHDLNNCYGRKAHGWDIEKTIKWATAQQFDFLAERFQKPYLTMVKDSGILVACEEEGRKGLILKNFDFSLKFGTSFRDLQNICLNPLLIRAKYCSLLEIADIIVGITTGCFANNKYALALFDSLVEYFLMNPHEGSTAFASTISSSTIGFGLILFPSSLKTVGDAIFKKVDSLYVYSKKGLLKQ